jgi:hypothetical protein
MHTVKWDIRLYALVVLHFPPCSLGLSATSQQYFSLTTNQPPATSQQYSSLRTNQHQPSATSPTEQAHLEENIMYGHQDYLIYRQFSYTHHTLHQIFRILFIHIQLSSLTSLSPLLLRQDPTPPSLLSRFSPSTFSSAFPPPFFPGAPLAAADGPSL